MLQHGMNMDKDDSTINGGIRDDQVYSSDGDETERPCGGMKTQRMAYGVNR